MQQYVLVHTSSYYLMHVCPSRANFLFHTFPFPSPQSTYNFILTRTRTLLFLGNIYKQVMVNMSADILTHPYGQLSKDTQVLYLLVDRV